MKSTFDIMSETTELFWRFASQLPENYMQEIFGKDDPVLADRCLQLPKLGIYGFYTLLHSLTSDEKKSLTKYINSVEKRGWRP